MKKLLLLLVVAMASISLAVAAPACVGLGQSVVGLSCEAGGLLFSNFSVSPAPPAADVKLSGVTTVDNKVNMLFSPTFLGSVTDIILIYQVTGLTVGVDLSFTGTPSIGGDPVKIQEVVCDSQGISGSACVGTTLVNQTISGSGSGDWAFPAAQDTVTIMKDIQQPLGATITHFTNSHTTPEPMSFVLMGTGLLGLGLIRRVRK